MLFGLSVIGMSTHSSPRLLLPPLARLITLQRFCSWCGHLISSCQQNKEVSDCTSSLTFSMTDLNAHGLHDLVEMSTEILGATSWR